MVYMRPMRRSAWRPRESIGFNSSRLNPDIYMDELLCGMRMIHQVLPAMKKLGTEDFKLDESELWVN
jgi:hypothetical protein